MQRVTDTFIVKDKDKAELIAKVYYVVHGEQPEIEHKCERYVLTTTNGQFGTLSSVSDHVH